MKYYVMYSGGKDSSVVAHLLNSTDQLHSCVFLDTGINAPDLLEFLKTIPYPLEIYKTPIDFDSIVRKYGFGRADSHNIYFNYLKDRALRLFKKAHKGESIILASGVRRYESKRRFRNTQKIGIIAGMEIHAPLYDWTDSMVWEYIRKHNIEMSPTYEKLHISGDCFCGSFARSDEKGLIKIFYPEIYNRIMGLELEVGGTWGNQRLPRHRQPNQMTLEQILCQNCMVTK